MPHERQKVITVNLINSGSLGIGALRKVTGLARMG